MTGRARNSIKGPSEIPIKVFLKNPIVQNTIWMLAGQTARISLQAFYFLIIARKLGAQEYGAFASGIAFVALFTPFSGLGFGNLLVRNVSRDEKTFSSSWGDALLMTGLTGGIFLALAMGTFHLALPASTVITLILLIGLSDLIFMKLVEIAAQAFQALEFLKEASLIHVLMNIFRCVCAVVLFVWFREADALAWGIFYCLSSAAAALCAVALVHNEIGRPSFSLDDLLPNAKQGFQFSAGMASQNIYNDIDKVMLSRLSGLHAAGIYAAGYRIIDVAFVPVRSLLYACYPRFFQTGKAGLGDTLYFGKRMARVAIPYALYAGAILFLIAPLIPYVLGNDYFDAVEAVRWLSPLLVLKTLHFFAADSLTGAGYQWIRMSVQMGVALLNVLVNLWVIPRYSWRGAAWVSLLSDAVLALSLWVIAFILIRRHNRNAVQRS